jgi:hypothetical protein
MSDRLANEIAQAVSAAWPNGYNHRDHFPQAVKIIADILDRATPPPPDDVAGQIKELREFLGDLPHVTDYETGIAIVEHLVAALESLSRERAVLADLLERAAGMLVHGDAIRRDVINKWLTEYRDLALIGEGEKEK